MNNVKAFTGRDLITYIMENGLEDKPICEDGKLVFFQTISEAACKFEVGPATISAWITLGQLPFFEVTGGYYIPANACKPNEEAVCVTK